MTRPNLWGRLKQTATAYSFLSGNPFTIVYGYDAASNRVNMTDPNNGQTTYSYDTLSRPTNITDFNNNSFGFGYDALSRRTQLTRANGINTNYGYDSVSNLLSVLHQQGASTLDGTTYTYDSAGNRKSKTNLLNSATSNFSYDNTYQLTGVTGPNPEAYTYDAVGNRLMSQSVSNYAYNSSNELTAVGSASYTYDDNGNTRTKTDSTGTTTYTWDFENRLTSVQLPNSNTMSFKYDPFGRRIQKSGTSTTNYVYDGAGVIEEVDQSENLLAKYSQSAGIDEPLSELRSGAINYYEQDGLGSVTSLSNLGGALANTEVYDAFGNLTSSSGTVTNPYQYTGRDYDPETGLRYYRARYYDPSVGRFLSEDPIQFGGAADFYEYVGNGPTNYIDPFGLLKVLIWNSTSGTWGHTAVQLDDGTYISFWPADGAPKNPFSNVPSTTHTQALDIEAEGKKPDEVVQINGLDELAIAKWWTEFKNKMVSGKKPYQGRRRNCSTVAALALMVGGATQSTPQSLHPFYWTPEDVLEYVESIIH